MIRWRGRLGAVCVLLWLCASSAAAQVDRSGVPAEAESEQAAYAARGAQGCLVCHGPSAALSGVAVLEGPHSVLGNPRAPLATEHQCEACHGPSQTHLTVLRDGTRPPPAIAFNAAETAEHKDAPCLGCHQREAGVHWTSSVHRFEQVACTDCHTSHVSKDPVLTAVGEPAVCYQCHAAQRSEMLRRSAHPVAAGLMQCSDCHAPHGGPGQSLLARATLNDTCYDCHAEKRGPFLWEHAPVREDCTNCHRPHGSNHLDLLAARTPWLCQQCHLAQFHPSTALSGMDVPPRGASHLVLARDCMNCHTQVHGSNHPSGPGLTR
jgi:DmsE family decaheme c-type cytochrome